MSFLPDWDMKHFSHYKISNGSDYNRILTHREFWDSLPYDKVLIFQHDSMILRPLEKEFMDYSYVGAPWKADANWNTTDRRGGNGGISLRDVKEHVKLLSTMSYNESKDGNEDVWYSHNLPNVAPYEICVKFGVETEFKLDTCTYHAIESHLTPDQCNQIKNQYETK
jgi:hypothetical protein